MKKYSLIILGIVFVLTGCTSKSSFPVAFDTFTMKVYDNNKIYTSIPGETNSVQIKVLFQMKEVVSQQDTGFINSFIVTKMPIQSGTDIKALVDSNVKNLQLKLLKYKNITTAKKKVKCTTLQYSGYMLIFSYQLDKDVLYEGEYFFTYDTSLYIVSLSSDNEKDINGFAKSIATIKCDK